MDIVAAIVTHMEPAELMKPTDRSLHHPAIHTQAAAVGRPPLGQLRVDPAVPWGPPAPLRQRSPGPPSHGPGVSGGGRACRRSEERHPPERHGLIGVRSVRRDGIDDQGHALTVGENRVFAAQFRAIDGGLASRFYISPDGADMARVHHEPFEVDPAPAERRWFNKIWWNWSQTPAACQSRKWFQQVMPQPQPIS